MGADWSAGIRPTCLVLIWHLSRLLIACSIRLLGCQPQGKSSASDQDNGVALVRLSNVSNDPA